MDLKNIPQRPQRAPHAGQTTRSNKKFKVMQWITATAVFFLLFMPGSQTYSAPTIIYETSFEVDPGWVVNPSGTDTAITGIWEVGDPEQTENAGFFLQPENAANGSNALVTDPSAGSSVGEFDIDGGVTSVRSPDIALPDNSSYQLFFKYYFGHNSSATSLDFFQVKVVGSSTTTIVQEVGDNDHRGASWTTANYALDTYAGETIHILVEASDDTTAGALVEAGIDDVIIFEPIPLELATFDSGAEGFTYVDDAFRNTNQPTYADGSYQASGGNSGGGLQVELGGINGDDIDDMSGGWLKTFTVPGDGNGYLTFDYQLTVDNEYESDEYGEALISLNGTLLGLDGNDYLIQIDGEASNSASGWQNRFF